MCDGLRGWAKLRSQGHWLGLGLLLVLAASGRAQAPADPSAKTYTNKMSFYLPIKLDERSRGNLREVLLFVKAGAGEWRQQDAVPPTQNHFTYKVTQDGEYWFGVVLVDQQGRRNPPDVSREPPALMVVVDTQPPAVELQATPLPDAKTGLRLAVKDANPDPRTTTVTCQMPDQTWRTLTPADNDPNVYVLSGSEAPTGMVRVVTADRAGNLTRREFSLGDLTCNVKHDAAVTNAAAVAPKGPEMQTQRTSFQQQEPVNQPASPPVISGNNTPPAPLNPPAHPEPVQPVSATRPAGSMLLNTTRASVNYRIDHVGPSGVGKVEVWVTSDKGQNWKCMGEDLDKQSPAEVVLPGDGVYGVKLVVTNGNGFGGKAPIPGEAPTSYVEVDTTAPKLELGAMDATSHPGHITVRWTASDKNLGAEPVELYYATRREGPWLPIARGVKNDGNYRWAFPRDATTQFFVRIDVTDSAGNVARAETPAPIVLDVSEPNATVVNISGGR
jgi:hypothetical protein